MLKGTEWPAFPIYTFLGSFAKKKRSDYTVTIFSFEEYFASVGLGSFLK